MSQIIQLDSFTNDTGSLTVIEKSIPFEIKRVFYIYDADGTRGGHRHKNTMQALICIKGSCDVSLFLPDKKETIHLNSPEKCLIVNPEEWHTMDNFSPDAILLVLASTHYSHEDYIFEPYES